MISKYWNFFSAVENTFLLNSVPANHGLAPVAQRRRCGSSSASGSARRSPSTARTGWAGRPCCPIAGRSAWGTSRRRNRSRRSVEFRSRPPWGRSPWQLQWRPIWSQAASSSRREWPAGNWNFSTDTKYDFCPLLEIFDLKYQNIVVYQILEEGEGHGWSALCPGRGLCTLQRGLQSRWWAT